jgi:hypothetical protein
LAQLRITFGRGPNPRSRTRPHPLCNLPGGPARQSLFRIHVESASRCSAGPTRQSLLPPLRNRATRSSPRGPRLPRAGSSPGTSELRNGRAPTRLEDRVSVTPTPLTASRSLELKSVAAVVELSPPRAMCRSPSICPPLSVRVHLRDLLKPAQGSTGLVFVPGALNCSSELGRRRSSASSCRQPFRRHYSWYETLY